MTKQRPSTPADVIQSLATQLVKRLEAEPLPADLMDLAAKLQRALDQAQLKPPVKNS